MDEVIVNYPYQWTRTFVENDEECEIDMETVLELKISYIRGRYNGEPSDCWPNETYIDIISGDDELTPDEYYDLENHLDELDVFSIIKEYEYIDEDWV